MPEATLLHIQGPGDPQPRIKELLGTSVRIGRGNQCEIRLPDPVLAEVHCLLRRRGMTWYIQPVGPPGLIHLEGQAVEQQRVLPMGAALRVGEVWLMLRPGRRSTSFDTAPPADRTRVAQPVARPYESPGRPSAWQPPPVRERKRQQADYLQASLREAIRQARLDRLNMQSGRPAVVAAEPIPPVLTEPPPPAPAHPTPSPAPPPVDLEPTVPSEPTPPPRYGLPAPRARQRRPEERAAVQTLLDTLSGVLESRARRSGPERSAGRRQPRAPLALEAPVRADCIDLTTLETPVNVVAEPLTTDTILLLDPPAREQPPVVEPPHSAPEGWREIEADDAATDDEPLPDPRAYAPVDPVTVVAELEAVDIGTGQGDHHEASDPRHDAPTSAAPARPAPAVSAADSPGWRVYEPVELADGAFQDPDPRELPGLSGQWPRVSDILACAPPRRARATAPGRLHKENAKPYRVVAPRRSLVPSDAAAPRALRLPGWIAGAALGLVLLGFGALALRLSVAWMQDDRLSGQLAAKLLREKPADAQPVELETLPPTAWWRSTARHLTIQAAAIERADRQGEAAADIEARLSAARNAAPLEPALRLATIDPSAGAPLGLSRDIVTLERTGRSLLRQGRTEAGLKAFRQALEMAAEAKSESGRLPAFLEDSKLARFTLPGEELIAPLIQALAEWSPDGEQWRPALPDHPLVHLVLARQDLANGEPAADAELRELVEAGRETGPHSPLELAAAAEASALLEAWDDSATLYQQAIADESDEIIRRTWAFNLAEVEARRGHRKEMLAAWEAARGNDRHDPLNLRLIEARNRHGDRGPDVADDSQLLRAGHQSATGPAEKPNLPALQPVPETAAPTRAAAGAPRLDR